MHKHKAPTGAKGHRMTTLEKDIKIGETHEQVKKAGHYGMEVLPQMRKLIPEITLLEMKEYFRHHDM